MIVAAGRGERLGYDRPKALVLLAGRPMLEWSIDALREVEAVDEVVVALPREHLDAAPAGTVAVAGGEFRSQSVRAALGASGGGDPVIVHDAARPLAEGRLFEAALAELATSGADAVVAAAPVPDTIKEVATDGRTVVRTLDRGRLWAIQTPQVFRRAALEMALGQPDDVLTRATDDAWLIERAGGAVRVFHAEQPNIKVTTEVELQLAETLLSRRVERS